MTEIKLDSKLKKRTLYIFLVRTNSWFSRMISFFTQTRYTHASIGFDPRCECLYSFARLYTATAIPAGFVKESADKGLLSLSPNAPCAVFRINVTEQAYSEIRSRLHHMYLNKSRYGYNYIGPVMCFFGIPLRVKNKYFCSQFVAETLARYNVIKLTKPASLYHPRDIEKMPELEKIYEGKLSHLRAHTEAPAVNIKIANG